VAGLLKTRKHDTGKRHMLVLVTGSIRTGSYENKEGKKVYTTDVWADRVDFLEPKATSIEKKQESKDLAAVQKAIDEIYDVPADDPYEGFSKLTDDIPF